MMYRVWRSTSVAIWPLRLPNIRSPSQWHRAILGARSSLADRHGANDLPVGVGLLRVVPRPTHAARASQMLQQLLLQGTTRLNEQAAVDGLV
jgi:hypothetical protein